MFLEIILYIIYIIVFGQMFLEDFKTYVEFRRLGKLIFDILVITVAIMALRDTIVDIMMV